MSDTARLLRELAEAHGISTTYQGQDGSVQTVDDATLVAVLAALGQRVDADGPVGLQQAIDARALDRWSWVIPPTTVVTEHYETEVPVHFLEGETIGVHLELETGTVVSLVPVGDFTEPVWSSGVQRFQTTFRIPSDLPLGYHLLVATVEGETTATGHLIVVPERLTTADAYRPDRGWGLAAQLYSTRSTDSWGLGDWNDLEKLCRLAADHGGDFVLTNPLHATEPLPPVVDSPYSPTSRSFLNPIYLHLESLPEYRGAEAEIRAQIDALGAPLRDRNTSTELLDRNPVLEAKLAALRLLYHHRQDLPERTEAYRRFRDDVGVFLDRFALRSALRRILAPEDPRWEQTRTAGAAERAELAEQHAEELDFHRWVQFLCDAQLRDVQTRARDAGMRTGVMVDLAVGANRRTADWWLYGEALIDEMSVGAPPDMYNQLGQDWSQHPWNPRALEETGYEAYRTLLRTVLRQAGAVRIDHILGLSRLWWIPQGFGPQQGAYVRYDPQAMIGILLLEAQRANVVVVGEDLGTVEPWFQQELASRGILGTSIVWFEHDDDGPIPPESYREQTLVAVNTHDLPPTAGYLTEAHLHLREQLRLLTRSATEERREFRAQLDQVLRALVAAGALDEIPDGAPSSWSEAEIETVILGLHRYVASSPAVLLSVSLTDAVGDRRIQNQPGTLQEQYPNWCVPLSDDAGEPVLVDALSSLPRVARLLDTVNESVRGAR
ncbi:4-alpha-glucanotransferase [Citricoccus sp. NR2]|uniref:4-alpha-glucanotransferase n=1 Tax=Citricoccus sp. NR2 TaxID=3004095 RepID=UPI0022DE233E|nr:4-alpha-glucanotransferase [Citricoccus sp. NR2]WBL18282.1 4-alpha-glucanotransferase [Citricoccus sp. NR2]